MVPRFLHSTCEDVSTRAGSRRSRGSTGRALQWHRKPLHSFSSQGKEQGEHTWGKAGSQRGSLVRESHHWEWNPSPRQMEQSLFTSLGCDIHSVHLAGSEEESCQQIPWKDHSAPASIPSFHVNQCVIQPGGEGIMERKHQAMKCSTLLLINTND